MRARAAASAGRGLGPAVAAARALALAAVLLLAATARAQSPGELLKRARDAFEYGDYARVVQLTKGMPESGALPDEADRIDAYRLLGLSHYYLRQTAEAEEAFKGLLRQNPDYQLDPFYVPPVAVAFFDDLRKRSEPYLAPIRELRRRRAREELEAELARVEEERRRRAGETPTERTERLVPVYVDRLIAENSRFVASLPFGAGQFQNGDPGLGMGLAAGQVLASGLSIAGFAVVEALRDPDTGRYSATNLATARGFDAVKWASAGLFYALWAAGVLEAHLRFVPTRALDAPPSAAPAGPLRPAALAPTPP
jgi:HAMP domain-containing protein